MDAGQLLEVGLFVYIGTCPKLFEINVQLSTIRLDVEVLTATSPS